MKKSTAALAVLILGATPMVAANSATAAVYRQPSGHAAHGTVTANDSTAVLKGTIRCWGGTGTLWASLKQGGSGDLTAEGSSATARSWYDTHVPLTCDGTKQHITAILHKEAPNPGHPDSYKKLRDGRAFFQWCVTDSTFDGSSPSGLSSNSGWRVVNQVS